MFLRSGCEWRDTYLGLIHCEIFLQTPCPDYTSTFKHRFCSMDANNAAFSYKLSITLCEIGSVIFFIIKGTVCDAVLSLQKFNM